MPTNQRIYYPIHALGFARLGTSLSTPSGYRACKGVQNYSKNVTFALEQVFELGQLSLYENIENIPNIDLTVQKVIDGYSLIEHLATPTATSNTLAGRYNDNQCMAVIAYYPITNSVASGTPLTHVRLSGLYVRTINWNIPVEGNITESVTLTCRDATWYNSPSGTPWTSGDGANIASGFTGSDSPYAFGTAPYTHRRQHVLMTGSLWPSEIPGITSNFNPSGISGYGAHIQNVTISLDLGRTDLFELGRKGTYFRYANFPVAVNTSISVTASESGDAKDVSNDQNNLSDQPIKINFLDGMIIDLGTKNKLTGIDFTGGDTGGGNATITYNYQNFNDYICTYTKGDPAAL